MSFLKIGLASMAALMAMFEMGVATDDLDKLDPQSGSAQIPVLSSASGSEALPVTRRPVPLVTQFARPPSSLSYELAALFDEDPWSIRRGGNYFYVNGSRTLYGSLLLMGVE